MASSTTYTHRRRRSPKTQARLAAQAARQAAQEAQDASAPAVHARRIAEQDARMPEALRNVLSRPVGYNAPLARSNAAFSIWK